MTVDDLDGASWLLPLSHSCCSFDDYKLTTEWLLNQTSHRPKVAVICGSGLGLLADGATGKQTFRYQDIPNFPVSTGESAPPTLAERRTKWQQKSSTYPSDSRLALSLSVMGHEGCLVFGTIEDTSCVFMQGHFHLYEGYSLCQVSLLQSRPINASSRLTGVRVPPR